MRVIMLGSDRTMFQPDSRAAKRMRWYAGELGDLTLVVASLKSAHCNPVLEKGLSILPSNSYARALYGFDIFRIVRKLPRPDVISSQGPFEFGLIAWVLARLLNVPLHVQVHTDFFSGEFKRDHWPLNALRVPLAGFVLRRADRIRTVSQHLKEKIESTYGIRTPVSVLPIYTNLERFRTTMPSAALSERFSRFATKVLIVSRLESEKNVMLGIGAFARSAPKNACLIILGEGNAREELEMRAKELAVAERTFFEGFRDPAEYYALSDVVLCTSQYEGYGMVIIEALAAGKPIISTDVGIAREAGAIIAAPEEFPDALEEWFKRGPRAGQLAHYFYKNSDEYLKAFCGDLAAAAGGHFLHNSFSQA